MGELTALLVSQSVQTAAGVGNTYAQTAALRGQQNYANGMAGVNAEWIARDQAAVRRRGELAGSRAAGDAERLASRQRVAYGSQGVDVGSGSAAQIQAETLALGEIARLQAEGNAMDQMTGLEAEQLSMLSRNRMNRIATRHAIRSSITTEGMNVGRDALRAAYSHERYKGLGKKQEAFDYGPQQEFKATKAAWNLPELD